MQVALQLMRVKLGPLEYQPQLRYSWSGTDDWVALKIGV
jgi:hypothetical protein